MWWPCVFCCCLIDFWLIWCHSTVWLFSFDCEMHAFIMASGKLSVLLPHRLQLGFCGCPCHSVLDLWLWSITDKCSTTAVSCSASPGHSAGSAPPAVLWELDGFTHAHQHQFPACHMGTLLLLLLVWPTPCFSSLNIRNILLPLLSYVSYPINIEVCLALKHDIVSCFMPLIMLPSLLGLPFSPVLPTLFLVSSWRSCFLFQFPHLCHPLPSTGPGTL